MMKNVFERTMQIKICDKTTYIIVDILVTTLYCHLKHYRITKTLKDYVTHEVLEILSVFIPRSINGQEPGSSVSIVSGYKLDGWVIRVRSPVEAKDFSSSLCVQTGSVAHPASCPMGAGGPSPGAKARPGHDADHSPPSSAEVKNK
jgi:hypothetical protein